ncbi:MAG: prolipoprotein diacylglyceryl transferase [Proteobacteria bacterium]|nr:prolipoprotein diacylglyceryl transferase [Pseudomonadota bacterium]
MNSGFLWRPDPHVYPLHLVGLTVYELMMWLALGSGTFAWVLSARKWRLSWREIVLSVISIGVVCTFFTRAVHIAFWSWNVYMKHPNLFMTIFEGGHAVQGSIFGFIVFALIFSRMKSIPLHEVSDGLAWWPPLGLMFVRLGNFWVSEIRGTPTDLPWGVKFWFSPDHGVIARHPVQLYEAGFCLILLTAMLAVRDLSVRKRPFAMSAMVLIGYSAARFLFDFIKENPGTMAGSPLTTGQIISIPLFTLGIWLALVGRSDDCRSSRTKGPALD